MDWLTCHCATNVIGVSKGVVDQLVADGLCQKEKASVVRYGTAGGIDTNHFSREAIKDRPNVRMEIGIPEKAFVFCFVGRIVKDKGINELVSAFDRLSYEYPNMVHLLMIGPEEKDLDPIETHTQILIDINKHIHAVGRQSDVRPYLRASDAFVLPSYREGLGQVLLEANAMDVPCIATDIIGPRDVIEPSVNGELVEARNTNVLYEKMREWVEHPELVESMSKKCRLFILSRYTEESVRDAYYKEYCRLAEE